MPRGVHSHTRARNAVKSCNGYACVRASAGESKLDENDNFSSAYARMRVRVMYALWCTARHSLHRLYPNPLVLCTPTDVTALLVIILYLRKFDFCSTPTPMVLHECDFNPVQCALYTYSCPYTPRYAYVYAMLKCFTRIAKPRKPNVSPKLQAI